MKQQEIDKLYEKPKHKSTAMILAFFFGGCTWLYTYREDAWKFWVSIVLNILLWWTLVVPIGVIIWSLADTGGKSDDWYKHYYKKKK